MESGFPTDGRATGPILAVTNLPSWSLGAACGIGLVTPPEHVAIAGFVVAALLAGSVLTSAPRVGWTILGVAAALVAINLRFSMAPGRSIPAWAAWVLAAGALCAGLQAGWRAATRVSAAIGAAAVVLAAAVIAHALFDASFPSVVRELPSPAVGGLILGFATLVGLAEVGTRRRWSLIGVVPVSAGLVIGHSWTATIACSVVLLVGGIPRRTTAGRRNADPLVMAIAASTVLASAVSALMRGHGSWAAAVSARLAGLEAALACMMRQPFLGTGVGSLGSLWPAALPQGGSPAAIVPGDAPILVVEAGLPGLALLAACAFVLIRRIVRTDDVLVRWILAGVAGVGALACLQPCLTLPSIAVPALALAGITIPFEQLTTGGVSRGTGVAVAAAVIAAGCVLAFERHACADPSGNGMDWAPWSAAARMTAAESDLARGLPDPERTARSLARLAVVDPESPETWRLAGDAAMARSRLGDARRAYERARIRAPMNHSVVERIAAVDRALGAPGLSAEPFDLTPVPRPTPLPWIGRWSTALLWLHLLAVVLTVVARVRKGPDAAVAVAVLAVVALSAWGEGGRLSGAILGRAVLLSVAGLAWVVRRDADAPGGTFTSPERAALVAIMAALLASTLAAEDIATARDGMVSFCIATAVAALAATATRARRLDPRRVLATFGAVALLSALVLLVQRGLLASGRDFREGAAIALWGGTARPAGDFFHAGHLGTFLLAAGVSWIVVWIYSTPRVTRRIVAGAGLVALGLSQGARASLLGLLAGFAAAAFCSDDRRIRRGLSAVLAAGVIVGVVAVIARFSVRDPYAWGRLSIWRTSIEALGSSPLLGFGPFAFESYAPNFPITTDPASVLTRYHLIFKGPHSDVLGLLLFFGVAGATLIGCGVWILARRVVGAVRIDAADRPWRVAALAVLAVFAGHGLVDDLVTTRPAVFIVAAALFGTLWGSMPVPAEEAAPPKRRGRAVPCLWAAVFATALLAWVFWPWVAESRNIEGRFVDAASTDRLAAGYWLAAARDVQGDPRPSAVLAYDRVSRAAELLPHASLVWQEVAAVLESSFRGPFPTRDTLEAAVAAWDRAILNAPHAVFARRSRGRLRAFGGDIPGAIDDFRLAVDDEPNFLAARLDLVRALDQAGQRDESRRALTELSDAIRRIAGQHPVGNYQIAVVSLRAEERAEVEQRLVAAGLEPTNP